MNLYLYRRESKQYQRSVIKMNLILYPLFRCRSDIGYRENQIQEISLGSGCEYRGTVAHEIMHLLGFYHEHTRQDREQYITVYSENIQPGMCFNV